ncbi:MAG: hypothetical protein LBB76_10360 [Azoarcus sp.]|jgi:hypothetical protein|nr:hypothetical protein [Azoarcus sp.]
MNILKFVIISVCFITNAYADPRAVDAEQFDIAGVKLGMSSEAAVSAISAKLGIDKRSIKFADPQPNAVTNSKESPYFTAKTSGASITVYFAANVPYDPKNKMAVDLIIYEQPWSSENASAMQSMAIEKYGQPSNGTISPAYDWCLQPNDNPGIGCFQFNGPKLQYHGTELRPEDARRRQAVSDFISRRENSKPVF